jgi:uncharacterized membrane protein
MFKAFNIHQQHGQSSDILAILQQYFWVILLIIAIPLVIILLYRTLYPNLNKASVTQDISKDIEKETATQVSDESKDDEEERKKITETSLRLLESDERRVVKAILEAGGSMLQKNISKELGLSRVKTHRILVRLIRRNVVTSEKYYNTNRITLSEWLHKKE